MMLTRRHMMLSSIGFAVATPSGAFAAGKDVGAQSVGGQSIGGQSIGGLAFGSSWRITAASGDLPGFHRVVQGIIADIDMQMSPYIAQSDISKFNAARTTEWQQMPHALCTVAGEALEVAGMTGGHFDPTVGPLVSRLGFGPITGGAGSYTGIEVAADRLRKSSVDLTLDLCGIAKGFALDRIVEAMRAHGMRNALVDVGGEVRALGQYPEGRPWTVAIADPTSTVLRAWTIVAPGRLALATSGHAANGVTGRVSVSHIIDPQTGAPASPMLRSVSVLAPTAMRADVLATALCAAGPVDGIEMARRLDIPALFIIGSTAQPVEVMTAGFRNHVVS
ncbi:FAD:protein FMN transferase [Pontivivens nitratireducens]|uniref:FAD:protein FMN transferase n=1 Tax=Pontivivens nitratireducens TaxID=2758038 RepID=A0A6G7VNI6_9RHOB|nr:FAD:protein FMN transferase [Pontibrevibacter nitratireducens]QIK41482.1 FAD:protein FMN transferase [Pontibrevibacter nitratireducens]